MNTLNTTRAPLANDRWRAGHPLRRTARRIGLVPRLVSLLLVLSCPGRSSLPPLPSPPAPRAADRRARTAPWMPPEPWPGCGRRPGTSGDAAAGAAGPASLTRVSTPPAPPSRCRACAPGPCPVPCSTRSASLSPRRSSRPSRRLEPRAEDGTFCAGPGRPAAPVAGGVAARPATSSRGRRWRTSRPPSALSTAADAALRPGRLRPGDHLLRRGGLRGRATGIPARCWPAGPRLPAASTVAPPRCGCATPGPAPATTPNGRARASRSRPAWTRCAAAASLAASPAGAGPALRPEGGAVGDARRPARAAASQDVVAAARSWA